MPEGGEPIVEPTEGTFFLVGELVETGWDETKAKAFDGDTTFTLAAGTYSFKVLAEVNDWDHEVTGFDAEASSEGVEKVGGGNIVIKLTEATEVTIKIVNNKVVVLGNFYVPAEANYYLIGSFVNWSLNDAYAMENDEYTVALEAGAYDFRVLVGERTWANTIGFTDINTEASSANLLAGANDNNIHINLVEGDLTVKVVEGKLVITGTFSAEAPVASVWNVVGPAALFGEDWNINSETTVMTKQEDGTFVYVMEDKEFNAGDSYEWKVVANHSWSAEQYPARGNFNFTIAEAGTYTLTFTLDLTKENPAQVVITKEGEPIPADKHYYLIGQYCDWNFANAQEFVLEEGELVLHLDRLEGNFKVVDGLDGWDIVNQWGAYPDALTIAMPGDYGMLAGNGSVDLSVAGSDYYTDVTLKLVVAADGAVTLYAVSGTPASQEDKTYYLVGAFCGWELDNAVAFTEEEGELLVHVDTLAGNFKVVDSKILGWTDGHNWGAVPEYTTMEMEGNYTLMVSPGNTDLSIAGSEYYTDVTLKLVVAEDGALTLYAVEGTPATEPIAKKYYLAGTFTEWATNRMEFVDGAVTVDLTEGATEEFKVVVAGASDEWYGADGTMTRDNAANWELFTTAGNVQLTVDQTGTYTFRLNTEDGKIVVTVDYPSQETGLEAIMAEQENMRKFIYNGQLYIRKGDRLFNAQGQLIR